MESMPKPSMESDDKLHIVMVPWLAFGHMIPFLELSKLIAQKGQRVSFVSTPRNINRLPKMPPNLAPLINLVKLQFPQGEKLPENAESTADLPYDKKPIIPIGLLPTTVYDSSDNGEAWTEIKDWLDKQSKRSVVYVPFRSEAKPSQAELTEIAFGLELSELPFFWVLRNRLGVADTEVIELPNEFEERTKERGVVCTSWAPQLKILSHDSVGGFLSHSGLSSVVEAIQFKKPLILLPSLADTGLIARLLEEKRMAYLIPREEQDGLFTRDSVADSLRLVIVEDEGRIYREKVKEMSAC
ncbi:hypothetical protein TEA_023509 [Camellia sinensis var. sinensis]|uniref:UDP-glycosyltransferases domain-containing protein n=1 Tax=Camellia sinensis var. sinensis TaxID=542762 RepID=A0A4S4E039_CAMSN|nr:hypothetical protein TEA_023509 [Camellia sinensis var. sinensis]